MSRYRKIDPRMWDDEKFIGFDDLARSLWFLLLTGPAVEAVPGLQVGGVASLAETLRRPEETVRERLGELLRNGSGTVREPMIEVDERLRLIRICRAPCYNKPENPNQIYGWFRVWQTLPESPLKYAHLATLRAACEEADRDRNDWKTSFVATFEKAFASVLKPLGNRSETVPKRFADGSRARAGAEQEQEQEILIPPVGPPQETADASQAPTPPQAPPRGDPPRERAAGSKKPKHVPMADDARTLLERWQARWSERYGCPYPETARDRRAAQETAAAAERVAAQRPPESNHTAEDVAEHWLIEYLRLESAWLDEQRHPLSGLLRDVQKLGVPWAEGAATVSEATEEIDYAALTVALKKRNAEQEAKRLARKA